MELYILCALEDGQTLPTPTSIRSLPCTDTTYPTLVQTDIDLSLIHIFSEPKLLIILAHNIRAARIFATSMK